MLEAMLEGTPASFSKLDNSTISGHSESHNQKSPILFQSDEESDEPESYTDTSSKTEDSLKYEVDIREEKYVKNLKKTLAGIPPPPKFTIPQYSAAEMLDMYYKNAELSLGFLSEISETRKTDIEAMHREMTEMPYEKSFDCTYHGFSYNRGTQSVEFESLCDKYRERYVGCETSSTVIDKAKTSELTASAKKKARKHPWNYSPGRRLSHLARRRQIFTSANIGRSNVGNKVRSSLDSKKMIMLDKKKQVAIVPANRTKPPSSSSNSVSVSSSSCNQMPTLKRALFQSPDCSSKEAHTFNSTGHARRETPRSDKNKARRALFSSASKKEKTPNKRTPNKNYTPKKHLGLKRTPHKSTPTSSKKKTPRKSLFSDPDSDIRNRLSSRDLFNANGKRMRSESMQNISIVEPSTRTISLSNDEKKKMLWAIYHCLKEKKINSKSNLYKPCQNYLYRLCSDSWKKLLLENTGLTGKVCNVSEKMLSLARNYVSGVILKVKNNQSFYNTKNKLDKSSESGDTSASHTKQDDQSSVCEGESVCESFYCKSESSSVNVKLNDNLSPSSYHHDEDTNTTSSAVSYQNDDTNTLGSVVQNSETTCTSLSSHCCNSDSMTSTEDNKISKCLNIPFNNLALNNHTAKNVSLTYDENTMF